MSTVVVMPGARPRLTRRIAGRSAVLALWAAFGFGVIFATVLAVPSAVGRHSMTILSGSMTPTLRIGDVVIDKQVRASEIRRGDIITFSDPDVPGRLLTHRVVRFTIHRGIALVTTRGDANTAGEQWSVPANGSVGRVEYRIPKLGYLVVHIRMRWGRMLMIAIPAFLLGIYELKRLWFPKEHRDNA